TGPDGAVLAPVPSAAADLLDVVDVAGLAGAARDAAVERAVEAAHAGLSLTAGPLLRAVLFRTGAGEPDRLFLAVHHMAVDVVSWQALVPDLTAAYLGVPLPPRTTSVRDWARRLADHAASPELAAELPFWRALAPAAPLPVDHDGPNSEAAARTLTVSLPPEVTSALVHQVPAVHGARVHELLLAALGRAVTGWSGGDRLLVDLEGHGREDLFDDVDLTRTVGWFTSVYPVSLPVGGHDPAALVGTASAVLRGLPGRGIGYGLLRRLHPDPAVRGSLAAGPVPQLRFNYTGQRQDGPGAPPGLPVRFTPLAEQPAPAGHSRRGTRPYLLDIDAGVHGGRLHVSWSYASDVHDETTVRAVAEAHLAAVTELVGALTGAVPAAHAPLLARMAEARVPGVSVAVISGGEVAATWAHGVLAAGDRTPVSPDTLFQAGSISKLATALVVLRLVAEGRLGLDDDVTTHLRSWTLPDGPVITVRRLLDHTAGLDQVFYLGHRRVGPVPALADVLAGRYPSPHDPVRRDLEPGAAFRYSGSHYAVLQQLLEDVTGEPFAALARRLVLDPLGMTASSFDPLHPETAGRPAAIGHDRDGVPVDGGWRVHPELAVGSLWATAGDAARLLAAVHRAHRGSEFLPRHLVDELLRPGTAGGAYGLGVVVETAEDGDTEFGHTGETVGYRAVAIGRLRAGSGVVVLTNGDAGSQVAGLVTATATGTGGAAPTAFSADRMRAALDPTTAP
ncbi:MAG TPA: serine hydrolase, partial [Pseudonocardiaceae bacterium]